MIELRILTKGEKDEGRMMPPALKPALETIVQLSIVISTAESAVTPPAIPVCTKLATFPEIVELNTCRMDELNPKQPLG
jgi:hypothetical protein